MRTLALEARRSDATAGWLPSRKFVNERPLGGNQFSTFTDRKWPLAAVEFSDVANHVNCTTRQRSRGTAA